MIRKGMMEQWESKKKTPNQSKTKTKPPTAINKTTTQF